MDNRKDLFQNVLYHVKCIQLRVECAKAVLDKSPKYKNLFNLVLAKAENIINTLCSVLENTEQVLVIKKELENNLDIMYTMLFLEQLTKLKLDNEDKENINEMIEKYLTEKYGKE